MLSWIRVGRRLDGSIDNFLAQSSSNRDSGTATEPGGEHLLLYTCKYCML